MADTPFLLKPREVAKKTRAAYKAGNLGFQRGHDECFYDYGDGSGCAIGVAMPRWLLDRIPNGGELEDLRASGYVTTETARDFRLLALLQDSHDRLCEAFEIDVPRCKRRFLRRLRACEAA